MKRVGIVLLQLLVTGAGLWYVFHDQQKLDANILECGDPAAAGPLSKRGHVRALQVVCLPRADAEKFPI